MRQNESHEIILNGKSCIVLIDQSANEGSYRVLLEGKLVGTVERQSGRTHSSKFIATSVDGQSAGGVTRRQAAISMIYACYKEH